MEYEFCRRAKREGYLDKMFCADICSCKGYFQGLRVTEGIFEGSFFNMVTKADYLKNIEKQKGVQEKEERRKRIS